MMDIVRNPSRLQEMTRTMDRQMQNLESLPGNKPDDIYIVGTYLVVDDMND